MVPVIRAIGMERVRDVQIADLATTRNLAIEVRTAPLSLKRAIEPLRNAAVRTAVRHWILPDRIENAISWREYTRIVPAATIAKGVGVTILDYHEKGWRQEITGCCSRTTRSSARLSTTLQVPDRIVANGIWEIMSFPSKAAVRMRFKFDLPHTYRKVIELWSRLSHRTRTYDV